MASEAQKTANAANAQHSTGPKTKEGKAASSQNNHRHGLAGGIFHVLPWEDQDTYLHLLDDLLVQHQPQTYFEESLVQKIAQHFWLSQRAVELQQRCFDQEAPLADMPEDLALYMRYQALHDRAYLKYSDELRKLRNESRKVQIGFESQRAKQTAETRRAAAEIRKNELHSKRLAVLDAQISRLVTPSGQPKTPSKDSIPAQTSQTSNSKAA